MYVRTILKLKFLSLFHFSSSRVSNNYFNRNTDLNKKAKKVTQNWESFTLFSGSLENATHFFDRNP